MALMWRKGDVDTEDDFFDDYANVPDVEYEEQG